MKSMISNKLPEIWLVLIALFSVFLGYFIGTSVKRIYEVQTIKIFSASENFGSVLHSENHKSHIISQNYGSKTTLEAERLPPGIVEAQSDLFLRGCVGNDTVRKTNYLLALTVGIKQKDIVNKIVSKFSENSTLILFHYDGNTNEWDQFEWSQRAIHVSVPKQTKWWYAKRFLHPDIVDPYDYIFIWDEDLGVDHFIAEEYIKLVKKYGLEISQPGVTSEKGLTWEMTKKNDNVEVHRRVGEIFHENCHNPDLPPCAGFIEIMAPVFSRKSWRCVWHMIQNDLVHGWGLDFAFWRCVEKAHENMGVVDAQWIEHLEVPSLGEQGQSENGKEPWVGVRDRCQAEWREFEKRMEEAEKQFPR